MNETLWNIVEYFGVLTGLIYLYLEYHQKKSMWIVSIINALTYIFVYAYAKIYADMLFYIFNVAISIYGLRLWRKSLDGKIRSDNTIEYQHINLLQASTLIFFACTLFLCITLILIHYTDSPVPILDGLITALSIIGTWMTARRFIEHWLVWTTVNAISVPLFFMRDIIPTAILFTIYTIVSIIGYFWWKHKGIDKTLKKVLICKFKF